MATLRRDERVEFVEDHIFEIGEDIARVPSRDQKRQLFGRRQEDVRRLQLLALALDLAGVAGARLQRDGKAHLGDGAFQIAANVGRERLQGRDVERVDAAWARAGLVGFAHRQIDEARQETGQRLAGAGRRDEKDRGACLGSAQKIDLVGPWRPAMACEPGKKAIRQDRASGTLVEAIEVFP